MNHFLTTEYGYIWKKHRAGEWIIFPISGSLSINHCGKYVADTPYGIANSILSLPKYKNLKYIIGDHIANNGYTPCVLTDYRMITYPTRFNKTDKWSEILVKDNYLAILKLMEQHGIERAYTYPLDYKSAFHGPGPKTVYNILKKYFVKDKIIFMENMGENNG